MLRLPVRKPCIGIEITASAARVAVVSGRGANLFVLFTKSMNIPDGVVNEDYASPNILDLEQVTAVLQECMADAPSGIRRAGLSLPDSVFRVQTLEFDELPGKAGDRERLIRWRLEKGAAFDIADTVLRYQVLGRQDKGFTVLSCVAKQAVIAQYESLLIALGLEPWAVGPSSFYTQNFYASYLTERSEVSALAHVSEDSFATIIRETTGARFYRFKDVKRGGADDVHGRLMREIDDSLHFYSHMDRSQQSEVRDLYLTGESVVSAELAEEFRKTTSLNIEVLAPVLVLDSAESTEPELAAALGAGSSL
jgi:Tfp pilus assembly PilM family ATPase